jgi:hypothetical protein
MPQKSRKKAEKRPRCRKMPLPCADAETLTELRAMPISMLASDDWPKQLAAAEAAPQQARSLSSLTTRQLALYINNNKRGPTALVLTTLSLRTLPTWQIALRPSSSEGEPTPPWVTQVNSCGTNWGAKRRTLELLAA